MKRLIYLIFLVVSFSSCMEEEEIWNSSVEQLAGNYFVRTYDTTGNLLEDYKLISTYNTAADDGTMVVNLNKVIALNNTSKVQTNGITFNGSDVFTISNGQLILDAALSKAGNTCDSIYMLLNDGVIDYVVAGHRQTGFVEDNY